MCTQGGNDICIDTNNRERGTMTRTALGFMIISVDCTCYYRIVSVNNQYLRKTLVWFLTNVYTLVSFKRRMIPNTLTTSRTYVWFLTRMYTLVYF